MKRKEVVLLISIFLVALLPRLFGLSYGLPHLYLEDEEFFVQPALHVAEGHLNPGWFGAPGQPLIYGLAFLFRGTSFIANLIHHTSNPVTINYQQYITTFQTVGRAIPALAGALLAVVVYFIGKEWSKRAGVIAGFLVAGSFYLVDHSHIIRPDILQTLFVAFLLLFVIKIVHEPKKFFWYVLAAVAFGLAITTKFPSLVLGLPMLFVMWKQKKDGVWYWRGWKWALAITLLTVLASAPFLFLDPLRAGADILHEAASQHGGHDGLGFFGNLWWYVSQVLGWQLGTFFYLSAIGTCVFGCTEIVRKGLSGKRLLFGILFSFLVVYLIFISALSLHWERWIIPVAVLLMICAGIGLDYLFAYTQNRKSIIIAIIFLCSFAPLFRTARTIASYALPHTEEAMREWIMNNIPTTAVIAQEPHTPELPSDYSTERFANMTVHSSEWFQEQGFTYYIISGGVHGIIEKEALHYGEWSNYGNAVKLYGKLFSESTLLYEARGHPTYDTDELLYRNDFAILKTFDIQMSKGSYQRLYTWQSVDGN